MKFWPVRLSSIAIAILGCVVLQLFLDHQNDYLQRLVIVSGLYVTLSVSLNLINGITGQFSIGHAAFYQVGAYTGGYLSVRYYNSFHPPLLLWLAGTMLIGGLLAALAGFVVGLPSLRLRGDYLAIVTLGFGEIIRIVVENSPALGASYGLTIQPKVKSAGLVWLLAITCIAMCRNLLKTAAGLQFLAVREDEVASSAMGVNVTRTKVTAFVLGSAFAGGAGALMSSYEGFINPPMFDMSVSFIILTMVVLGGTGSVTGSIVSAIFLTLLPEYLRHLQSPSGGTLTLTGGTVVGWMIAAVVTVAGLRLIYSGAERSKLLAWLMSVSAKVVDVGGRILSNLVFKRIAIFRVREIHLGPSLKLQRLLLALSSVVVGLVVQVLASDVLNKIKALQLKTIEIGQLRLVIFAVTLISLMLLRPQGVFAHHEFSWDWLMKRFSPKKGATV